MGSHTSRLSLSYFAVVALFYLTVPQISKASNCFSLEMFWSQSLTLSVFSVQQWRWFGFLIKKTLPLLGLHQTEPSEVWSHPPRFWAAPNCNIHIIHPYPQPNHHTGCKSSNPISNWLCSTCPNAAFSCHRTISNISFLSTALEKADTSKTISMKTTSFINSIQVFV